MPSGARSTSRPGAGPGRGRPRARAQARPAGAGATTRPAPDQPPAAPRRPRRASSLTARAIALSVVLLVLVISYASSLRIYFAQAHEIAQTKAEITARQQRITELRGDLARWNDPSYVQAQARARLGWVVPGEKGYTVIGADGKPLGGGVQIGADNTPALPAEERDAWWDRMWGSVETTDRPAPKTPASPPKPITVKTKPR